MSSCGEKEEITLTPWEKTCDTNGEIVNDIDICEKHIKMYQMIKKDNAYLYDLVCQRIRSYVRMKKTNAKSISKQWLQQKIYTQSETKLFIEWITKILDKINNQNFLDSIEWMGVEFFCSRVRENLKCEKIMKIMKIEKTDDTILLMIEKSKSISTCIDNKSIFVHKHIVKISNQIKIASQEIENKMDQLNNLEIKIDETKQTIVDLVKLMIKTHEEYINKMYCGLKENDDIIISH